MEQDQPTWKEFEEDFPLLLEAGFIAVKQLDEKGALALFEAAKVLKPRSVAPRIGLGYIAMNKMEVAKATGIFEAVVKEEPEHYLAQTFLGICYALRKSTRKQGEALIRSSIEKTTEPSVKRLGEVCLQWIEKDFTKAKAPFFAK